MAAPPAGTVKKFRRWNLVLIALLVFLVLGVFVVAEAPTTGGGASRSANASLKENQSPASRDHAKSIKGAAPDTHGHNGSLYRNKDLKTGHHTG